MLRPWFAEARRQLEAAVFNFVLDGEEWVKVGREPTCSSFKLRVHSLSVCI